jgi:hypothetical protein
LEKVASLLAGALVNIRGEWAPSGMKCCSFKEFDKYPLSVFEGNLESEGAKNWLINLKELLRVMDFIEEQRVKYAAYKFFGKTRQLWYDPRDSLVMELGSEKAIKWTQGIHCSWTVV